MKQDETVVARRKNHAYDYFKHTYSIAQYIVKPRDMILFETKNVFQGAK